MAESKLKIENSKVGTDTRAPNLSLDREAAPRGMQALVAELQEAALESRDRLAEIEREKERITSRLELATAELHSLRSREEETRSRAGASSAVTKERDQALADAARERKLAQELQDRVDSLTREPQSARGASPGHGADTAPEGQIDQLQRQIRSIRQARDTIQAQVRDLTFQSNAKDDVIAELEYARDTAADSAKKALEELEAVRSELEALRSERDDAPARAQAMSDQITDLMGAFESDQKVGVEVLEGLKEQLDTALGERARAVEEAIALQAEVEALRQNPAPALAVTDAGSMEDARAQLDFQATQIEELLGESESQNRTIASLNQQIHSLNERETELEKAAASMMRSQGGSQEELEAANKRSEEHRQLAIELGAQLDASRREITGLTASLAVLRMEAAKLKKQAAKAQKVSQPVEEEDADPVVQPLTALEAQELLGVMSQCHKAFLKSPSDFELIKQIYSSAQILSERAGLAGMVAFQRLSGAFASLAHHLHEIPESINSSSERTMHQTIEFLRALVNTRSLLELKDPAQAKVFAVDDDPDACETIAMSLEMVLLDTLCSQDPALALSQLATGRFDLVFLDVNLPGLDGFELCSQIRLLEEHSKTPIVFITGTNSPEFRAQSVESGGNDFIAKPFNLHELGVKALSLIIKNQTGME